MREYKISFCDEGQKLIKFLFKLLPGASKSLIYKSLRKKNILYNNKKANGNEIIKSGDVIEIWFSDETLENFSKKKSKEILKGNVENFSFKDIILYENEDIIVVNKPKGMLSQRDISRQKSLNDYLLEYIKNSNYSGFKPSICNRLDKNTSGTLICAKTFKIAREINELIKNHVINKKYLCLVFGDIKDDLYLKDYLFKNVENNKAIVSNKKKEGFLEIKTKVHVIKSFKLHEYPVTFLEVTLLTGKFHQIRAHLSYIGHPILGDRKYGNNESLEISKILEIGRQLLHSYSIEFPENHCLKELSGMKIKAPIPKDIMCILNKTKMPTLS